MVAMHAKLPLEHTRTRLSLRTEVPDEIVDDASYSLPMHLLLSRCQQPEFFEYACTERRTTYSLIRRPLEKYTALLQPPPMEKWYISAHQAPDGAYFQASDIDWRQRITSLRNCCFSFLRRFFSPGSQRWQKVQFAPEPHPFAEKAHGLQKPA